MQGLLAFGLTGLLVQDLTATRFDGLLRLTSREPVFVLHSIRHGSARSQIDEFSLLISHLTSKRRECVIRRNSFRSTR